MGIDLAVSAAMMIVFRCMFVVCLIPCFASADLPKEVAGRFTAAQDSIDNEAFRGSYSLSILSWVKKPGDDPGETTEMEWGVTVDPTGEEARRLVRYIVDGEGRARCGKAGTRRS